MPVSPISCLIPVLIALATAQAPSPSDDTPSIETLEEQAFRSAVDRVAPSVVMIETIGGAERVGDVLVGTGPTTGLIVSPQGHIVSSKFNFVQRPASVLVRLPSGTRLPARIVATDHSRMLVLLKVETEEKLAPAEAVPPDEMKVGQWAIAVGRAFAVGDPHRSVGVVSAVGRMFGRAIQTDAKISPNNYGGPLVDLHGRVLGVLVPMAPGSDQDVAGLEWYDGGIGFAVPLATVHQSLPRLREGHDLYPGVLGIGMKTGDRFSLPAVIALAQRNSPAHKAGFQVGDEIVAVDGQPVSTQIQLRMRLGPHYAGDTVPIVVRRGDARIERAVTLVDKVPPVASAFLGMLPRRDTSDQPGVVVRFVYPGSPADKEGVQAGDRLVEMDGRKTPDTAAALEALAAHLAGETVEIKIVRGAETLEKRLVASEPPVDVPAELPPAMVQPGDQPDPQPEVGRSDFSLPQMKNRCLLYVPEKYQPDQSAGVLVWLHGSEPESDESLLKRFQPTCDRDGLILVAPRSLDPSRWLPTELEFVAGALDHVRQRYHIDPARVVAHGYQAGGAMAYLLALRMRGTVSGVAPIDAPLPGAGRVPANDPTRRLAIFTSRSSESRFADRIDRGIQTLRTAKYPVTVLEFGEKVRYLSAKELNEFSRWIDTLDRI